MTVTRITSFQDGPRLTVNALVKNPTVIPKRVISMMDQMFLVDKVLRSAPGAPGGAGYFHESTPLFAANDSEDVEEFGEIPATTGQLGDIKFYKTIRKSFALMISQQMIDRNNWDAVRTQMTQLKNTFTRNWEDYFLAGFLGNSSIPTLTAPVAWGATTASATQNVYFDLAHAVYNVMNADADSSTGVGQQKFGFEPNRIILNRLVLSKLLTDANVVKVLQVGDAATRQPVVAGVKTVGNVIFGAFNLEVVPSWRISPDKAIILEKNTVGGISDERPFGATPLYEIRQRETWRSDISRVSGMFIDQPKAAVILSGINGGSSSIANF
jgi:hypothetical protein